MFPGFWSLISRTEEAHTDYNVTRDFIQKQNDNTDQMYGKRVEGSLKWNSQGYHFWWGFLLWSPRGGGVDCYGGGMSSSLFSLMSLGLWKLFFSVNLISHDECDFKSYVCINMHRQKTGK